MFACRKGISGNEFTNVQAEIFSIKCTRTRIDTCRYAVHREHQSVKLKYKIKIVESAYRVKGDYDYEIRI